MRLIIMKDGILTVSEISARLRLSKVTTLKWLNKGIIPGARVEKQWRSSESAIEALVSGGAGNGQSRTSVREAA
jgi:excisionase family DNA binding protein